MLFFWSVLFCIIKVVYSKLKKHLLEMYDNTVKINAFSQDNGWEAEKQSLHNYDVANLVTF